MLYADKAVAVVWWIYFSWTLPP